MAAILLVSYSLPYAADFKENWMLLLGVLIPAITVLMVALFKKRLIEDVNNNRVFRILEAGFLMMGCMHFLQANQLLPSMLFGVVAMIILFLLWMEGRMMQDQYIMFEQSHIELELPLATRKYMWEQLQAVMIKDEYITLSFKDNKIQQLKIQPNFVENEEGDFLFFCQDCIRK